MQYPAISPLVVAVGGTSLQVSGTNYVGEKAWGYGSDFYNRFGASGGGISSIYSAPSWQAGVQTTGHRTTPDVSSNADPSTGVAVYDSTALKITLGGTPITSSAGRSIPVGTLTSFQVEAPNLTFLRFGLIHNDKDHSWNGTIRIVNNDTATIKSPIFVIFSNLTAGTILMNATGTVPSGPYAGDYYLETPVTTLNPGAYVSAVVRFSAPTANYTPILSLGALDS